jgi:hypothetical protein
MENEQPAFDENFLDARLFQLKEIWQTSKSDLKFATIIVLLIGLPLLIGLLLGVDTNRYSEVLSFIFGLVTAASLFVTLTTIHKQSNQIFDWAWALRKVERLITASNVIQVFFWTPLIGGVSHRKMGNEYTNFLKAFRSKTAESDSQGKKIDVICLDDHNLQKLYERYKRKNGAGDFPEEDTNAALAEVRNFISSNLERIQGRIPVSIVQSPSEILPTWYFIVSEKELIVLLPFFMPIHDFYTQVPGKPEVQMYGFATTERYMIKVFRDAFDFYRKLAAQYTPPATPIDP